jgi:hypothetical protein
MFSGVSEEHCLLREQHSSQLLPWVAQKDTWSRHCPRFRFKRNNLCGYPLGEGEILLCPQCRVVQRAEGWLRGCYQDRAPRTLSMSPPLCRRSSCLIPRQSFPRCPGNAVHHIAKEKRLPPCLSIRLFHDAISISHRMMSFR